MTKSELRFVHGWGNLVWPKTKKQLSEARIAIDAGEALGLYIGEHPEGAYVPDTLNEISDFFDIKSMRFGQVPNLSSSGVERFQDLEALWIEDFEPFDIGVLGNLQKLSFNASKGFDLEFCLPKLKNLIVSKASVKNCQFVANYEKLEELVLLQAGKLESLNGLELASSLAKALIGYSPKLADIGAIEKCDSLWSLELCVLKKISSYESIFRNSNIRYLTFDKCAAIASLDEITQLKYLEHFALIDTDVVDGNLEPVLELPKLTHFGLYPNKKHFSPKAEVVKNMVASRNPQTKDA